MPILGWCKNPVFPTDQTNHLADIRNQNLLQPRYNKKPKQQLQVTINVQKQNQT